MLFSQGSSHLRLNCAEAELLMFVHQISSFCGIYCHGKHPAIYTNTLWLLISLSPPRCCGLILSPHCMHSKASAQRSSVSQCKLFTPLPAYWFPLSWTRKTSSGLLSPSQQNAAPKIMPSGIPVTSPLEALWWVQLQAREHLQLTSTPGALLPSQHSSSS